MHPGGAGSGGQGDKALSGAIQGLGDVIGRQRQLLDKSLRQGQGAGDPKDGGGKGLGASRGSCAPKCELVQFRRSGRVRKRKLHMTPGEESA
jgi:hypothetical protein